jgi:hypothetical protein
MHHHYGDIRSLAAEPPQWWDEYAVPRYCAFTPDEVANVYAHEVALVEIACQNCGARFAVAWSRSRHQMGEDETGHVWVREARPFDPLRFHFGDPPNAGCCDAGPTMNCEDLRVLQSWRRENFVWVRQPEKEIRLDEPAGEEGHDG